MDYTKVMFSVFFFVAFPFARRLAWSGIIKQYAHCRRSHIIILTIPDRPDKSQQKARGNNNPNNYQDK
jgi:hypothetical protein